MRQVGPNQTSETTQSGAKSDKPTHDEVRSLGRTLIRWKDQITA